MNARKRYTEATIKTADHLKTIACSTMVRDLTRLSLPEIETMVEQISAVIPAGNVPGVILNGLARLSNRKLPLRTIRRDIDLLFKGVEQAMDKAAYGMFFAGPAAVIWGYQNLLKLAGKEPEDAFPEGIWQFYVDYALREDTARHTNETHGFDSRLNYHNILLNRVDRITAWTMTAIHTLHEYDALLKNEWRERVYTHFLPEFTASHTENDSYVGLYRTWETRRSYKRDPTDAQATETFSQYRKRKFDSFLNNAIRTCPPHLQRIWEQRIDVAETTDLAAFQQQLSILAHLQPGPYGETRVPIPRSQAHIGLVYRGHYYLIPVCSPDSEYPIDVAIVRAQIATLLALPIDEPAPQLTALAPLKRTELVKTCQNFSKSLREQLDLLQVVPIIFNCDPRPRQLPLANIRQAERGLGHHPLTLFDTGETIVFDQSHIFFDGAWGAALAEIMTNEALSWAVYLNSLPPASPGETRPYALQVHFDIEAQILIRQGKRVALEVSVENEQVDLSTIQDLRRLFKQRNNLIQLTVNDLLILYRALHAANYQPNRALLARLEALLLGQSPTEQGAARITIEALQSEGRINPGILIPIDASQRSPRDRIYPLTFEVPLDELDLYTLHQHTVSALDDYEAVKQNQALEETKLAQLSANFDHYQREYLTTLAGFGAVMKKTKEIALKGESASVSTIKLLAHIPPPIQRLLDNIPGNFEVINDLVKGREVFSNLGLVPPDSTLIRFITAKDDNDQKTLAWSVMTDATGVMRFSLRDFRPHVSVLTACGQQALATQIAQDYLDGYVQGLNQFTTALRRITMAGSDRKR